MTGFRLRRSGSVAAEWSRYKLKSSLLSESAPLNKAIGAQWAAPGSAAICQSTWQVSLRVPLTYWSRAEANKASFISIKHSCCQSSHFNVWRLDFSKHSRLPLNLMLTEHWTVLFRWLCSCGSWSLHRFASHVPPTKERLSHCHC